MLFILVRYSGRMIPELTPKGCVVRDCPSERDVLAKRPLYKDSRKRKSMVTKRSSIWWEAGGEDVLETKSYVDFVCQAKDFICLFIVFCLFYWEIIDIYLCINLSHTSWLFDYICCEMITIRLANIHLLIYM